MTECARCGNDYDKTFVVERHGERYAFDSFECAIAMLAPRCGHCGTTIIGHGVEGAGHVYCCAACAREEGIAELSDRLGLTQHARPSDEDGGHTRIDEHTTALSQLDREARRERITRRLQQQPRPGDDDRLMTPAEKVEEASMESFPASDPPAYS